MRRRLGICQCCVRRWEYMVRTGNAELPNDPSSEEQCRNPNQREGAGSRQFFPVLRRRVKVAKVVLGTLVRDSLTAVQV